MSERGRSEPIRAQAPEKAPVVTPPLRRAPLPPAEVPERRRPSRLRRAGVAGLVAATLGAGAYVIPKALEQPQGQEGPGPTGPRVTNVEPTGPSGITGPEATGTTGPSVEPTKPPPFESTSEWVNSLGYISSPEKFFDGTTRVYSTGILADIKRESVDFLDSGEKMSVWVFKFYFGQDTNNKPIYMNFSYGPDSYNAGYYYLPGAKAPIALNPTGAWDTKLVDASVLKNMLENQIGHQFGLEIPISADSGEWTNWTRYKDNEELVNKLKLRNKGRTDNAQLDQDNIGFISGLYLPPKK